MLTLKKTLKLLSTLNRVPVNTVKIVHNYNFEKII